MNGAPAEKPAFAYAGGVGLAKRLVQEVVHELRVGKVWREPRVCGLGILGEQRADHGETRVPRHCESVHASNLAAGAGPVNGWYASTAMPRVWWYQRRYVFQMNVLVAVGVGSVCAMYGHLRWWSIAPAAAVLLALELALLSPRTAWFSIVVGTACSAVGGFVAGVAVAASQTNRHDVWWIAGALGVVVGAWLMLDAHRTLRRDRELTARGRSSPSP